VAQSSLHRSPRAQQASMPVIGWLSSGSPGPSAPQVIVFRQSLAEAGYVEDHNVAIEYRFAEGQNDRLPAMAADRDFCRRFCRATSKSRDRKSACA
jgi:hypothetical protein